MPREAMAHTNKLLGLVVSLFYGLVGGVALHPFSLPGHWQTLITVLKA